MDSSAGPSSSSSASMAAENGKGKARQMAAAEDDSDVMIAVRALDDMRSGVGRSNNTFESQKFASESLFFFNRFHFHLIYHC